MSLIEITEVRKSFGTTEVLKGINLDVEAKRSHRHYREERFGQIDPASLHQRPGGHHRRLDLRG